MPRPRRDGPQLKQRDNGIWYAGEFIESRNRTVWESLRTNDRDKARQLFAKYLVEGPSRSGVNVGVTVAQALDWYDADHIQPNVVDKQRQRDAIANLKAFFVDTLVRDVDVMVSRRYADARRRGQVKRERRRRARDGGVATDSTIRRELNVLISAVNSGIRLRKIPREEALLIDLPSEEAGGEVKWLAKATLTRALEIAQGHLHDFILLAYYTAARRRSIEFLTKAQVDLKNGRINLHPVNAPRTKKRKPIVPIYAEIRPTIERLMAESTTEYVFGEPRSFYREFVELMADLGVEAHPHMLRHSRATHMLMDGEDPYKVAKLLGDTLTTVERKYGHHSVDYLQTTSTISEEVA